MLAENFVRVTHFGKPVTVRVELGERAPVHADMLRHDYAFMSPSDPSLIIFPVFKTPKGTLGGRITINRWNSFSCSLKALEIFVTDDVYDWVTYVQQGAPDYALKALSLRDYLQQNPTFKVVGFQRVVSQ